MDKYDKQLLHFLDRFGKDFVYITIIALIIKAFMR